MHFKKILVYIFYNIAIATMLQQCNVAITIAKNWIKINWDMF